MERFCLTYPKKDGEMDDRYDDTRKEFKYHICRTVNDHSSFVLIDKVKNKDYYLGVKQKGLINPDDECERIVCIMVCELEILSVLVKHLHH